MTVTPFPSCCGAIIISSLWVNLEDEIRTAISTAKKEEKGLILAITRTDYLQEYAVAVLTKLKFQRTVKFVNPNTYRELQLWTKDLNPVVRKKKK